MPFKNYKPNHSLQYKKNLIKKRGVILIASIMLMVFVAIVVAGTTVFVTQRLQQTVNKENSSRLIDLAHAGVHGAIFLYRFVLDQGAPNGYFILGQINIDANNYFVLGASDADLLMVRTVTAALSGNGRNVLNLTMQNATNTRPITIDRMIVSWSGVPATLRIIRINNVNVYPGPNLATPANANIADVTLNTTPATVTINYLRFNARMANAIINVQFVMTDGSSKTLQIFPALPNFNFTVNSTGRITGSNMFRTIRAQYNAATSRIIDYDEINTAVP